MSVSFWDERYSQQDYVYGEAPNEFFKTQLAQPTPTGKLLLPAEGEGRNAVYAAKLGWNVIALDTSAEGRKKALALAEKNKVKINYTIANINEYDVGIEKYDVIGLIYAHFPPSIRATVHNKLVKSLKPGGIIILEAFSPQQLEYNSGGPKDVAMLYDKSLLQNDFSSMSSLNIAQERIILNEGKYHSGKANVIRMVGIK